DSDVEVSLRLRPFPKVLGMPLHVIQGHLYTWHYKFVKSHLHWVRISNKAMPPDGHQGHLLLMLIRKYQSRVCRVKRLSLSWRQIQSTMLIHVEHSNESVQVSWRLILNLK